MTAVARRWPPSLRLLLAALLAALGLLVAALIVLTTMQLRGSATEAETENRRTESFLLADSMRQSSHDLTTMVRLYVSTGEPRYRAYYDEILAIRAGEAPRPIGYDSSFWTRVLARGDQSVVYGPAESLVDRMRAAQFAPAEFDALNVSLAASNDLARVELEVMDRVTPRIASGVDNAYLADVATDYQRLVDDSYLAQKGVIMDAIDRFTTLVEQRTSRDVERARADTRRLFVIQMVILALIVVVGVAATVLITRHAVRPLQQLIAGTRRIASGDYAERVGVRAVAELERVAGAFNEMAAAVESDVRARQRAEREAIDARRAAEHANRAKSTFLAAMSHEIRTPMIGVTGMLEVLARTGLTPQQSHMLATADSSARSLLQIIGDILDFSKIEAERLELAPTTIDLRRTIGGAVDTFVHTASAKGLLLTCRADERLAPAHVGDPLRVRQIVSNLLSNAVKFTSVGGIEVDIAVIDESPGAQTVVVSVTDTGIGITPEQQRHLFDDFAQAEASTARRFGGTGLGLTICKRLAELMSGDITLSSTPDRGTTMRLTVPFPLGDPREVDATSAGAAVPAPTSRPKPSREQAEREGSLLLLAEDHPVNRTVLGHQLDIVGFHVDMAEDGQEALERYLSGRYGLLLTDLNMPRLDGYELARAIRRHERETGAERIPILALSANVMQGEPQRCRAAGMDDFAPKPTTIPALAAKLRALLPHLTWDATTSSTEPPSMPIEAEPDAIDPAVLAELTGGDAETAAAVLEDYVASCRDELTALYRAAHEGDAGQVRRLAHRIRGASRIVGATQVAEAAARLESAARADQASAQEFDRLAKIVGTACAHVARATART